MRHSNSFSVLLKAIEKSTIHVSRDFIELENLQLNPSVANKFALSSYERVKKVLTEDLLKFRPDYNITFSDGQKVIRKENAEYEVSVIAIDGFENMVRASADFTVAIALEHFDSKRKKETIGVAISKVIGGELFYCEKGYGAYLNNRRLRVSKRNSGQILAASEDKSFISDKNFSLRNYGCRTLEICYVASARLEKAFFTKDNLESLKAFSLLVTEAGGAVKEQENFVMMSN